MGSKKLPSLQIYSQKCSGCRLCELVCATKKNSGITNPKKSRIHIQIEHRENQNIPIVCLQCAEHPCLEACSFRAISLSGFEGIAIVDFDSCTGCQACVQACPYGAMYFDPEMKVPLKCDLCGGDPECVKNCLQKALVFDGREKMKKNSGA